MIDTEGFPQTNEQAVRITKMYDVLQQAQDPLYARRPRLANQLGMLETPSAGSKLASKQSYRQLNSKSSARPKIDKL